MSVSAVAPRQMPLFDHLMQDVFYKERPLANRVVSAVFHIFTLCIPYFYSLFTWYWNDVAALDLKEKLALQRPSIGSMEELLRRQDLSPVARAAVESARDQLATNPNITPYKFTSTYTTHQPENQEIARLKTLHGTLSAQLLEDMKTDPEHAWERPNIKNLQLQLVQIAYTIGVLMLGDLPAFAAKKFEGKRSYVKCLTIQDSYQYRAFYALPFTYRDWRSGYKWQSIQGDPNQLCFTYARQIPEEHVAQFYREGTLENQTRELYNDYCDRIRRYVSDKELRAPFQEGGDNRHANWTRRDDGPETFSPIPDTAPT